ncbi:MAG: hypothetical protein M1818_001430 [Claussenomyces sp. TS43310]|nr:MAG: hypothetical protein M1818_001430 [Claussenomyces sp. TS43310]
MTAPAHISFRSLRGQIYYTPGDPSAEKLAPARLPEPFLSPPLQRQRCIQITRLPADDIYVPTPDSQPVKAPRVRSRVGKLASRDNAKRVLGSVLSPFAFSNPASSSAGHSSASTSTDSLGTANDPNSRPPPYRDSREDTPSTSLPDLSATREDQTMATSQMASMESLPVGGSSLNASSTSVHRGSLGSPPIRPANAVHIGAPEKPIASANGISCSIRLAEPHVYLTGFDLENRSSGGQNSTALIRGTLILNITKSIKIKAVTLSFCGKARTEWPEGIPPSKSEYFEEKRLMYQVLPFYNAAYADSDDGYGAQCKYTLRNHGGSLSTEPDRSSTPSTGHRSSIGSAFVSSRDQKRLSLSAVQSRSFQKGDSPCGPSPQQKGYKLFHPGIYEYSFEISLDQTCPETIDLPLGSVRWMLEALVERAGTFKPNLHGTKEVLVIRAPDQNSLEQIEPIAISRKWEDQLHYDIVISGKSFPIGSKIPIAFKLTPLAKVQCHRIKVYITENADYFTDDKKVTRRDAQRKILLLERQAGKPLSKDYSASDVRTVSGGELAPGERERARQTAQRRREWAASRSHTTPEPLPAPTENLLGDLDLGLEYLVRQTEIEMEVQLPTCEMMRKDKAKTIHPDSTWKLIHVHHWIKIVMRLSRIDTEDPTGTKRRHFEISIDSPFHILSCLATSRHTALPEYSAPNSQGASHRYECGCPNAPFTNDTSPSSSTGSVPTLDNAGPPAATGMDTYAFPNLAPPPQAHLSTNGGSGVQRPIHMLRTPSFNPPPFDAEEPPPPMPTPPPLYDNVIGTPSHDGLADYFARLADVYSDDDHTDDEDGNRTITRTGRVNVSNPRTPGSRTTSRSMDINRNFMFRPERFDSRLQHQRQSQQAS